MISALKLGAMFQTPRIVTCPPFLTLTSSEPGSPAGAARTVPTSIMVKAPRSRRTCAASDSRTLSTKLVAGSPKKRGPLRLARAEIAPRLKSSSALTSSAEEHLGGGDEPAAVAHVVGRFDQARAHELVKAAEENRKCGENRREEAQARWARHPGPRPR